MVNLQQRTKNKVVKNISSFNRVNEVPFTLLILYREHKEKVRKITEE